MTQRFVIHPETPQLRLIHQAVQAIRDGKVIVYPTDSAYALGCQLANKAGLQAIQRLRQLDSGHNFTLVCRDLSEIAKYAHVDNTAYRLLKANTPGAYTFILKATSEVPRLLLHPKRKTIGIRIPDHPIVDAMLEELGAPILSTTLIMPGEEEPPVDIDDIFDRVKHATGLVVDGGFCGLQATTVIDLTDNAPRVLREGKADTAPFL